MRRFMGLIWLVLGVQAVSANIAAIDFEGLHKKFPFDAEYDFLIQNYGKFDHWTQEWKYDLPKETAVARLTSFSDKLEPLEALNPEDIDLALLLLTLYQYEYNLEFHAARPKFEALAPLLETRFSQDYRPLWFAAEFLANSSKTKEAIEKYQLFIGAAEDLQTVHPLALVDYANACAIGGMRRTAAIALRTYAARTNLDLKKFPFYGYVMTTLTTFEAKQDYEAKVIWTVDRDEKWEYVQSTFLGFQVHSDVQWKQTLTDYKDGAAAVTITPQVVVSPRGNKIQPHFAVQLSTVPPSLDASMDQFLGKLGPDFTKGKATERVVHGITYRIVPVSNSALYPGVGGMVGYAIFAVSKDTETAGFNLERPRDLPNEAGLKYYRPLPTPDRLHGDVYVTIIVDSAGEIQAETDKLLDEVLDHMRF